MNPGTVNKEKLEQYKKSGINRLSIGLQSTHDRLLKKIGRIHKYDDFLNTFKIARDVGFENINIDLMLGLPEQSIEDLEQSVEEVIKLNPEHISVYSLIVEEETPFYKKLEANELKLPEDELERKMYWAVKEKLEKSGYIHYEISNFCRPGMHSRHNSSYWTGIKYLGCGPSAHSYDGHSRQWNISSLDKYIEGINKGSDISEIEELDLYTRYNDFVITSIRTAWGMPLDKLKSEYGNVLYDYCLKMARSHISQGTLEIKDNTLKLTQSGIFISDGIMSDMLWVE